MIKKWSLLILFPLLMGLWWMGSGTVCATTQVNLYYQPLNLDPPPIESADSQQPPLLPLREMAAAMGADLSWDPVRGMTQLHKDHTTIKFRPGDVTCMTNYEELPLPEVRVVNGYTMVSLDFLQLALGDYFDIKWNSSQQVIDITYRNVVPVSLSLSYGSYNGAVSNGVPQGQGTIIFPDGTHYQGYFRHGYPTTLGTFYTAGGEVLIKEPVSNLGSGKGPNPPDKTVASENGILFYCDPSPAGSGQIYTLPSTGSSRFRPEIASCMDAAGGWLYYVNQSESGRLYRVAINGQNRQCLTDFQVCELVASTRMVFITRQVSADKFALYRLNPETQQLKLIMESKEDLTNLQIYNDKLYFTNTSDILYCDLNGGYIAALATFQNPISNARIQGGWFYYLQNGCIYRLRLDATDWSKVIDLGGDEVRDLWLDENCIWVAILNQGPKALNNGLYCFDIDGKNQQRILEGSYNLLGMEMKRLFFTNLPSKSEESRVLRSVLVREDKSLDWRNHSGDSNPDAQYGWPDSIQTVDTHRLVTNRDLAKDEGAAKIFAGLGINPDKVDIKIKDIDKILIVDPAELGELYSGSTANASKLRSDSVLLKDFGGTINGPWLKTQKGDIKLLQVWDKRDENGQPVFTAQLIPEINTNTISQNGLGGKHKSLIFLNYNHYWQGYLSSILPTCPHLLVSVNPGTYTIGYEQWDPTIQNPLNANRRNLVAIRVSFATE